MKYSLATLAIIGSVLAFPVQEGENPHTLSTSFSTYSTTPVTSTPSTSHASLTTSKPSSASASSTPTCDVESEGDNGNHYGWCKKAQHSGTYKNGKSDSESS
ncbi:uncharacterized protein N7446_005112 [Penicillium canescens]|uniref:Uncharacterized protein n=1 Tax=Penicillium canescens TaxID=5083 RepID=A0AAD6I9A3_PENCN|nr:uncharacterized protein N7446_005112 [Penicillium canescens]KAJ6038302.1 hypothetical protein N7460_008073 [Penicillium canescens]KAJ6039581.1 hypothetical protein N7444_008486 [Penicillium canescens]KAJ6068075.1 hypothetical protein N7446_005112 [Penicillium canescens]